MTLPTYDQLYQQFHRFTYELIRRNLGQNPNEIDDLQQEVWLKVHNRQEKDNFQGVEHFEAYLKYTTRGVISDFRRSLTALKRGKDFHQVHLEDGEENNIEDMNTTSALQHLGIEHLLERFHACMNKLSPRRRHILQNFLKGSHPLEIASLMGKTEANVRSLNSKAKQDMMDCMSKSNDRKEPLNDLQMKALMHRIAETQLQNEAHLDEAILKFFITDLLDEDEMDDVRDHLAICTNCKSKWRELMYLDSLVREELEREAEAEAPSEVPASEPAAPAPSTKSPLIQKLGPYALAAAIFFAMFFNPFEKTAPNEPSVVPFIDLQPIEVVRRSPERAPQTFKADSAHYLQLIYGETQPIQSYRLEITTADSDQVLWQLDNPQPDAAGTFSLLLPANYLQPGSYQVRLIGDDNLLHSYPFQVE